MKKYPVGLNGYERAYAEQSMSLTEKIVIAVPIIAGILSIIVPAIGIIMELT